MTMFVLFTRSNLLYQISNSIQTQKYSTGDLTNLKIILSMTNNHSSLEFSPVTYNLPYLLFDIIPSPIVSIITKWNSVSIGPQLKVSILNLYSYSIHKVAKY